MSVHKRLQAFKDMLDQAGLEVVEWQSTSSLIKAVATVPNTNINRIFSITLKEGDWRGDKNELARMRRFYRELMNEDPPDHQGKMKLAEKLKPVVEVMKYVQAVAPPPDAPPADEVQAAIAPAPEPQVPEPPHTSQEADAEADTLEAKRQALIEEARRMHRSIPRALENGYVDLSTKKLHKLSKAERSKRWNEMTEEERRQVKLDAMAKARAKLAEKHAAAHARGEIVHMPPHLRTLADGRKVVVGKTTKQIKQEKEATMSRILWNVAEQYALIEWLKNNNIERFATYAELMAFIPKALGMDKSLPLTTLQGAMKVAGKALSKVPPAPQPSAAVAVVAAELKRLMDEIGIEASPQFDAFLKGIS